MSRNQIYLCILWLLFSFIACLETANEPGTCPLNAHQAFEQASNQVKLIQSRQDSIDSLTAQIRHVNLNEIIEASLSRHAREETAADSSNRTCQNQLISLVQ